MRPPIPPTARRSLWRNALAAGASALLLAICAPSALLAAETATMYGGMKTYCFGRYLVDIPQDVKLIGDDNSYVVAEVKMGIGMQKFNDIVNETLEKRKEKKDIFEYVRSEYPENTPKQIIVSNANLFGDISWAIDAFTLVSNNISRDEYFFYLSGDSYDESRLTEIIEKYRKILNSVRYRADDEIPKEPGFCFQNGFVADDGKTSQNEEARLYFRLKNYPAVQIHIESDVQYVYEKTLLERTQPSAFEKLFPGKVKIVRQKARRINGIDGEESLVSFPLDDGTGLGHIFAWETQGELGNPLKPALSLYVKTLDAAWDDDGKQLASPPLTTPQFMELYESVVKTLRLRPVGEAKPRAEAGQP